MWRSGDSVLMRYVFRGRVRWAFPETFVAETGDAVLLHCQPGAPGKRPARSFFEDPGQIVRGHWEHVDHEWERHHVLWLQRLGRHHSLGLFWDEGWRFRGWYVNLQEPLRRTALGFDTRDHALDITVAHDGSWRWKDEDHLAQLVELGVFSPHEAEEIRGEGERVLEEWPFPTGWEDWRPDPGWKPPKLPAGWDKVV